MEISVRRFSELSVQELYDILKLRVNVFVVEQCCPYPELDDKDQSALHLCFREEGELVAYLRIMDRGVSSEYVTLGRVISARRRQGLGSALLREGIRQAEERFGAESIYLEAQVYAIPFYEKQGFRVISEEFPEDGIPHVKMLRSREKLKE